MLMVDNTNKLVVFHRYITFAEWVGFCISDEIYTSKPIHSNFENKSSDK